MNDDGGPESSRLDLSPILLLELYTVLINSLDNIVQFFPKQLYCPLRPYAACIDATLAQQRVQQYSIVSWLWVSPCSILSDARENVYRTSNVPIDGDKPHNRCKSAPRMIETDRSTRSEIPVELIMDNGDTWRKVAWRSPRLGHLSPGVCGSHRSGGAIFRNSERTSGYVVPMSRESRGGESELGMLLSLVSRLNVSDTELYSSRLHFAS